MNTLYAIWIVLFFFGVVMVSLDYAAETVFEIGGVPAFGVIGAALILLVISSFLNWVFKLEWRRRTSLDTHDSK